jgi:hypothetical protein
MPTAVTKIRGSLIIAGWENSDLDWAAITSTALSNGQSEEPGHGPGILAGDVLYPTSGQGATRKRAEGAETAEGSGQGQSTGGGIAKRAGPLGNRVVGSLTRTTTGTRARQTEETAVTATRLKRRGSQIGFDRPVSGSRATKEDDGTYHTDGRNRAGATGGGNYGGGSDHADGEGYGGCTSRGGGSAKTRRWRSKRSRFRRGI